MGKAQRAKGARGQSEAKKLLEARGWIVDPITCGVKREDMIATCPDGKQWSVEVKNCKLINMAKFRRQAREQARKRKLPYMVMAKIEGSKFWIIERQGMLLKLWGGHDEAK